MFLLSCVRLVLKMFLLSCVRLVLKMFLLSCVRLVLKMFLLSCVRLVLKMFLLSCVRLVLKMFLLSCVRPVLKMFLLSCVCRSEAGLEESQHFKMFYSYPDQVLEDLIGATSACLGKKLCVESLCRGSRIDRVPRLCAKKVTQVTF